MIKKNLVKVFKNKKFFINNLILSITVWRILNILTILGPFRSWANLSSFRSNKTKKATINNNIIIVIIYNI